MCVVSQVPKGEAPGATKIVVRWKAPGPLRRLQRVPLPAHDRAPQRGEET